MRPHPVQPPLEQRRRHQRRGEHDEQQRGVEIAAEDPLAEPDGREDQPDLAAGDHPEPDQQLVARRAERADRGQQLADDGDGEQAAGDPEHLGLDERLDPGADPDLEEEDRDEQVPDRRELALDPLRRGAAREREAGDERTDDRRELRGVGELREAERERDTRSQQQLVARSAFLLLD